MIIFDWRGWVLNYLYQTVLCKITDWWYATSLFAAISWHSPRNLILFGQVKFLTCTSFCKLFVYCFICLLKQKKIQIDTMFFCEIARSRLTPSLSLLSFNIIRHTDTYWYICNKENNIKQCYNKFNLWNIPLHLKGSEQLKQIKALAFSL